jgi:alkanesulfonate monooxygenase SsuD/methylene tetrahydromethanopterin reductase-like flavin-dependent oxidoreductase (luciferase family)
MPSPIVTASALARRTSKVKIAILGSALPLRSHPMMVAEEHAMIDVISGGRLVSGFVRGIGAEYHTFGVNPTFSHDRFHEAHDLIVRAWTEKGPFAFEGRHYRVSYVNLWPQPLQKPHPPIWIPGSNSVETMYEVARRDFCYFLSTRGKLSGAKRSALRFGEVVEEVGKTFHPRQMGLLFSVYVAETDEIARQESEEAVFYFTRNCLKGHQRRTGRRLTMAPGGLSPSSWQLYLENSDVRAKMLGDAENWDDIDEMGSIFVGGPDTVYQKLWEFISQANIGNLLIQFHIGNLSYDKTIKSQRIFAEKVLPRLRADSKALFARKFPGLPAPVPA